MFKKIHSNRDPGDTLYSEIKKEFGGQFNNIAGGTRSFAERYPRILFGLMIFCIAVSIAVVFTLRKPPVPPPKISVSPVSDGVGQILSLSSAMKETLALKKQVDSISTLKKPDVTDSALLLKDLDRLGQINKILKPIKP